MSTEELNLEFVRSQFPAFSEPALAGWAFFENAGGSYVCKQVIDRLTDFYTRVKVQPYAPYPAAQLAGEAMDEAYARLAAYLNVQPDEVSFGPSTTQNTYVLAQAFLAGWTEKDEIVVTDQDHEANSGVWRRLAGRGIVVREWKVDPRTGLLDMQDLDSLLTEKTRLVAFPHCSNVVGHLNPVTEICARAHSVGAKTVVDGVSYAAHGFPDVKALGADVYLFSLYKTYGPHQGLMVVRRNTLATLENQSHFFNAENAHKKLVPAGPDHAQVAASAGIADYFDLLHEQHFPTSSATAAQRSHAIHELFQRHERRLLQPLLDFLSQRDDVILIGPSDATKRAPTVALEVSGKPEEIAARLAQHKIMCTSGNFYAYRLMEAMHIDPHSGVLRLSFVHYTSKQDIQQLIEALAQVL